MFGDLFEQREEVFYGIHSPKYTYPLIPYEVIVLPRRFPESVLLSWNGT